MRKKEEESDPMNLLNIIIERIRDWIQTPIKGTSTLEKDNEQNRKMTREELLLLIKKNNGAEGLNLRGVDLSGVNLSEMNLQGAIFGKFGERDNANLSYAVLAWSNLENASFASVNMEGCNLYGANLKRAYMPAAKMTNCTLLRANLSGANLYAANLQEAELTSADLRGAYLVLANFQDAQVERESIGETIIQENVELYKRYFEEVEPELETRIIRWHLDKRYLEAARIYRIFKSCFAGTGNYEDASWAHIRERQMLKLSHHPSHAFSHYREEIPKNTPRRFLKLSFFYIRHTIQWLVQWIAELSCGYGERPLRVAFWSIVILLIFPFFYRLSDGIVNTNSDVVFWVDYFHYSLASFSTIGFSDLLAVNNFAKFLTSIEALLGISSLALLMFALGNRISQR